MTTKRGGRPAKPTALKLLHGDDKKNPQRINRAEPVPAGDKIAPSFELSPGGGEVWDRLAPDRIRQGVLTAWDVDAFSFLCEAIAVAQSKVRPAHEPWTPKPGTSSPLNELKAAIGMVSSLGSQFGWTPADRQKLVVGEVSRDEDADLLSG